MQAYHELFSFAKSETIALAAGKDCPDLLSLFHLLLSNQAYAQLAQLSSDIQILTLTEEPDFGPAYGNQVATQSLKLTGTSVVML
jgi:hypothetical protein